jgi:hypothetical protein
VSTSENGIDAASNSALENLLLQFLGGIKAISNLSDCSLRKSGKKSD